MTAAQIYGLIREVPPILEDWDFPDDPTGHGLLTCARFVIEQYQASRSYKKLTVVQRAALRRRLDLAAMRLDTMIEYYDSDSEDMDDDERVALTTAHTLFATIGQQIGMDQQQLQAYCESKNVFELLDA